MSTATANVNTPTGASMPAVSFNSVAAKVQEFEQLRQREATLAQEIQAARMQELKELPQRLGYTDSSEFVRNFVEVHGIGNVLGNNRGRASVTNRTNGARNAQARRSNRKARVTITPEMRAKIVEDFRGGKLSKDDICAKWNISAPTAQNIKKGAGLVRARK